MTTPKFVTIPKTFIISQVETNDYAILTSEDNLTIFKIDKNSIKKEGEEYQVQLGSKVEFIKDLKLENSTERIEIEIYEVTGCTNNRKFCRLGLTLCCDTQIIVGTCIGEWSDC